MPDTSGRLPLFLAVEAGAQDRVRLLLALNADPNAKDLRGDTPVFWAATQNLNDATLRMLLGAGGNPNCANADGVTALWLAAHGGRTTIVRALIAAGADPDRLSGLDTARPDLHTTPVHAATENRHFNTVLALAQAGANLEVADAWGRTPLTVAIACKSLETVLMLLEHRADPNRTNARCRYPLAIAALEGTTAIACALLEHGAAPGGPLPAPASTPVSTPVHYAAERGDTELLRVLLDAGAAPDALTRHGETPMHLAARCVQIDAVRALLHAGADPETPDAYGWTPLANAAKRGDDRMVKTLVFECGADPTGLARARDKALAFAMLAHKRLGRDSGLGEALSDDLVKAIVLPFSCLMFEGWQMPEEVARARGHAGTADLLQSLCT